jgi:hypothetical protein
MKCTALINLREKYINFNFQVFIKYMDLYFSFYVNLPLLQIFPGFRELLYNINLQAAGQGA